MHLVRDFYATSSPAPLDQADGLRRMFAGQRCQVLALASNPYVAFTGLALDRVAARLASSGRNVLVVDAGPGAPAPHELARLDLAAGIEGIAPRVSYLAARGLPLRYVDTRGSASAFIDALLGAVPQAGALLLHADAADLSRVLMRRPARPMLLAADHPESIKHAYANAKLLSRRTGLATFDLLLTAATHSPRVNGIVSSLAACAENFLGAVLCDWALIDPAGEAADGGDALGRVLAGQLALGIEPAPPSVVHTVGAAAPHWG
jgi:hypothetical protein